MTWEKRGNHSYVYRSARMPDGRVKKEYIGHGLVAANAEREAAMSVAARKADQVAAEHLHAELEPADQLTDELEVGVNQLVEAHLLVAGWHKHHGTWRHRRDRNKHRAVQER